MIKPECTLEMQVSQMLLRYIHFGSVLRGDCSLEKVHNDSDDLRTETERAAMLQILG